MAHFGSENKGGVVGEFASVFVMGVGGVRYSVKVLKIFDYGRVNSHARRVLAFV